MPPKVAQWIIEQEEQKILKELQEDWAIIENNETYLILINEFDTRLEIEKKVKRYECYYYGDSYVDIKRYSGLIDHCTHQLLHKLFELWGVV